MTALVEGNSIRATCRMTGVAKNTIIKLLVDLGRACAEYQDKALRNLTCNKIQCDEIWAFARFSQTLSQRHVVRAQGVDSSMNYLV